MGMLLGLHMGMTPFAYQPWAIAVYLKSLMLPLWVPLLADGAERVERGDCKEEGCPDEISCYPK